METKVIGERIAYLRKQQGISQKELAKKLQVSESALCKWERGQNCPGIITIRKIAGILQVSCNDILQPDTKIEPVMPEEPVLEEPEVLPKEKHKYWKWAGAIGGLFCILFLAGFGFYRYQHPVLKIVSERYVKDEIYGEIYEIAVLCPDYIKEEQLLAYVEEARTCWINDDNSASEIEVMKISFYENRNQARNWENTETEAYAFKVAELGD